MKQMHTRLCHACVPMMISLFKRATATPAAIARLLLGAAVVLEALIVCLGPSASAAREELRAAAGKATVPWEALADLGIHYGAVANLVLFILLMLSASWWTRAFVARPDDAPARRQRPWWQRWLLPALYVAGFASVYSLTSFAGKSLWWDEMWALKQCSLGSWKQDKKNPDQLKFLPTTWKRCAFYYQKPTNHAPMSLAQKASLTVWQKMTGAAPHEFDERAARLPALIASGIAVLLLMRLCGAAQGTVLGALLLLVHPWHLRYGVEARAYAFIVPLCISALLATRKVIFTRGRSVPAWVWLALNQAAWIWTYPNAVLDVLVLFIILGVFLWRAESGASDRATALIRLVTAHVFAAALWVQLFLPNVLQALRWAGKEEQGHQLDFGIFKDTLSNITFGMDWNAPPPGQPETTGLTGLLAVASSEALAFAAVLVMLALSVLGIIWAVRRQPRSGWLLAAPIISSMLYAGLGALFGIYYYPRFSIALLPVFVAGLSLCGWLFSPWQQVQRRIVMAVMILFVMITNHERGVLMARPYAGFKEAAALVLQRQSPRPPLIVCYGLGREVISVYLRDAQPAETAKDIEAAQAKARTEARELLVIQGYTTFNRQRLGDGMKLLDDGALFSELGAFPGIEPDFFFRVLKAN